MISIARTFGAPVTVPAGKVARSTSSASRPGLQLALDVRDDVHHVRVALDHHVLGDPHRADLRDAADVVAAEVDQHDVLGALLRVGEQLRGERPVLLGVGAAAARAGDRPQRHLVALEPHQDLRRRADDVEVAKVEVEHVRRRVERAQRAVERERLAGIAAATCAATTCTCMMSPSKM